MRTAEARGAGPSSDLTARARIREAAIECFVEDGFETSFRTIAQRAGVSPGLITHHFGSKDALRAECDEAVLREYSAFKHEAVDMPSPRLMSLLVEPGRAATLAVYMLRAIHAGGEPARDFLEHLIDKARGVMAHSLEAGIIRPSRDEEARLRYLTSVTLGAMLVHFVTSPVTTPDDFVASMHEYQRDHLLPLLELFTHGIFTDSSVLDDYVRYLWEPPDAATQS
ncbi:TetR/AcrR family transcriptional regulator [Cellulomonas composti]|uniref:TetR family transcriptional regulator n=1 Tax=Cellulomonas composti TaxID=266130 RepID=A0A511J6R4_9CELL|nr:TetR family transcriptional regulator [Cellulomonas composti]GEL93687.1 TetR family transcriptional regulator [Cellulomonas composti]